MKNNETLETCIEIAWSQRVDFDIIVGGFLRKLRDEQGIEIPYIVWKKIEDIELALEDIENELEAFDSIFD